MKQHLATAPAPAPAGVRLFNLDMLKTDAFRDAERAFYAGVRYDRN